MSPPLPSDRHISPDPLDANLDAETPSKVLIEESVMAIDPPRKAARSSVALESQASKAESTFTRRSGRVSDIHARKEQADREKKEMRAKRRAEKEATAKREEEQRLRESGAPSSRGRQAPEPDLSARKRAKLDGSDKSMRVEQESDRRRSSRTAPESITVLDETPIKARPMAKAATEAVIVGKARMTAMAAQSEVDEGEDDLQSWGGSEKESPAAHVPEPQTEAPTVKTGDCSRDSNEVIAETRS